jgi:microcystin-dependent protein
MQPIIGQIILFAGNFAPRGWAFCNGQLYDIADNPALYAILGTTYGGDGRSKFALPDLRGRVPVHAGQGDGLSPRHLGQRTGAETVTLTVPNLPEHHHEMLASASPPDTSQATGNMLGAGAIFATLPDGAAALHSHTIGNAGGCAPHDNMPPVLCLHYIIAVDGQLPLRG